MRLLNRDPDYGDFYYTINPKTRLVVKSVSVNAIKFWVEFKGDHGNWTAITASVSGVKDKLKDGLERLLRRELEESQQEAPIIAIRRRGRKKKGTLQ